MEKTLSDKIITALAAIVGPAQVSTALEERLCAAYDGSGREAMPAAVVRPGSADEVARIMTLLHEARVPVVARGAGSGMTGGAVPVAGGVVLSLARLNRILEIDPVDQVAVVEPGVVTADLQAAVAEQGLFYPPDPASKKFCTMGGNVAECAGGPRAVKYGVTRDYVKGLEVVLADGRLLRTGTRADKGVAGYDLTRLFVGSEGTLGIVTKIMVRLLPRPEARATFLVAMDDAPAAGALVTAILASFLPCTLELLDGTAIGIARTRLGDRLEPRAGALLLIELDGRKTVVQAEADCMARFLEDAAGVVSVRRAADDEERDELWAARRALSPAAFDLRPHKMSEDVVVPRSRIVPLLTAVGRLAAEHEVVMFAFGHAGDGNMHVNIMYDRADENERQRVHAARERLFARVIELGGTITGEHGVGVSKAAFLAADIGAEAVEVMRRLKHCLDPHGLLNPGKIFVEPS